MAGTTTSSGISRRDLLKRSAVAGGLIWVAPTILADPAAAQVGCSCPAGQLYGVKNDTNTGENLVCLPEGGNSATCVTLPAGLKCGICFEGKGLSVTSGAGTTVYTLGPALEYCSAGSKGSREIGCAQTTITPVKDQVTGITTVTIVQPTQSHTELIFCYKGSVPAPC